ncbi:A/B/D/E cyclin [Sporormia fimetaria CBS 119925]|uniref:A/B/D/E cyclin n=1 Tax=Sporormia fimetaria CBS 119925 TaxID=1340428 RepID=A0A6A6VDP7_9PLEO|nr:A/B/D/E cyclin [Sporormia fimetaria CBS 119925]
MSQVSRSLRTRVVTNENDENAPTTRLTRAKSAALSSSNPSSNDATKKPLQSKKSTTALNANGAAQTRKRAALGDVSNVTKAEGISSKEGKELKKPLAAKAGPVTKAAHPTKVQKTTRTTTRHVLKEKNVADLKRPASGSGVGGVTKKRVTSATKTTKKVDAEDSENLPPAKQQILEKIEEVEKVEQVEKVEKVEEVEQKVEVEEKAPRSSRKLKQTKHAVELEEEAEPVAAEAVPDLDDEDADDPLMVSEYVVEIFEYLRKLEIATMPNPDYMDNQHDLEWKLRGILIDWLVEVQRKFRLLPETLFLAVNIIDRFLSAKVVMLDKLQLVGVTAMYIASKYEEILSPHVQDLRHFSDDGFTEEEILSAERFILAALNYDLSYPNPMNFLRRISKADNYDPQTRTLGKYLMEISCLDHRFMVYPPSQVAAASMFLSRMVLQRGSWVSAECPPSLVHGCTFETVPRQLSQLQSLHAFSAFVDVTSLTAVQDPTLEHYSGYKEEDIQPVVELMIDYLASPVVHNEFFKKYASSRFLKASLVLRRWAKDYVAEYGNVLADA